MSAEEYCPNCGITDYNESEDEIEGFSRYCRQCYYGWGYYSRKPTAIEEEKGEELTDE